MCANSKDTSLKNAVDLYAFVREVCVIRMGSTLGVRNDLILDLCSHIFEYQLELVNRHVLECLQSARSEKERNIVFSYGNAWPFFLPFRRPVVGGETLSRLAPVPGPEQETWLFHPSPLFMVVSMILQ